jgi:hypothetical protein
MTIIAVFVLVSLSAANAKSTAAFVPRLVLFHPRHHVYYFMLVN